MKQQTRYLVSLVFWFCIGFAAWGDDLDIYLGTTDTATTYRPNVLFIMDTSGSMANDDYTGQSRMLRVKNALKNALSSATNINAGLMRFHDFGGPVLFPIKAIDEPIVPEIITSVANSADDASELMGSVSTTETGLVISNGTSTVYSGVRFSNLIIPQGATITSARLRFTSAQLNSSNTTMVIRGERSADSQPFSSSSSNVSSRVTTANEIVWDSENSFPVTDEVIVTPDISPVIQEIVDQSSWCGGQALSILLEGSSEDAGSSRIARSADRGLSGSPQLILSYDDTDATGCIRQEHTYQLVSRNDNAYQWGASSSRLTDDIYFSQWYYTHVGLRFQNLAIPQGADIIDAYLIYTAAEGNSSNASVEITAIDQDSVSRFRNNRNNQLTALPTTPAVTWTMPPFSRNREYASPNIASLIKRIVDRPGWSIGNNLGFIIQNFSGNRQAYSASTSGGRAPKLVVRYSGAATPGVSSTVREHLISKVDELSVGGGTPIVDTLYEATQYFGGRNVDYGLTRANGSVVSSTRRSSRVSHRSSYLGGDSVRPYGCTEDNLSDNACINEYIPSGATYISPVVDLQCQTNNHVVLLSDGEANSNHSVTKIQNLLGRYCGGAGGEKCGIDLVKSLSEKETSPIERRVITHTIGFAANNSANNFLNQLALQSGGGFYQAENSEDLVTAFETILRSVKDINATFVSPGVAVNQLNRLTHRNELYFALFKPSEGPVWPGNLKKYKISGNTILDQNGMNAVDTATGFFSDNAHSYW